MLKIQVQGSGKKPYQITAEGTGANFAMYCTCPAGRNGQQFCKHRRGLLYGDVTKVVEGVELISELNSMAQGSIYITEAVERPAENKKHAPPSGVICVQSLADIDAQRFKDAGFDVEYTNGSEPWEWQTFSLYGYFKNGKRKKEPQLAISWDNSTGDSVVQVDGTIQLENIRPRSRPFTVRGKRGASITSRAKFADAYNAFVSNAC